MTRKAVCLIHEVTTLTTWFCGLSSLFGVSLAYSVLVFIIMLVIKEAKRVKKELEKGNVSQQSSHNPEDVMQCRQQYFDMHYEKINRVYYIAENSINHQESVYSNVRRTESVASSKDTQSNNAELILRELFVPIQEDVEEVKTAKPRLHWSSVKDFPRRNRRSTSELQQARKLHSSLKQRSSLQLMKTVDQDNPYQGINRRPAIVFNSQLSFSDDTHSTMV